MAEEKKQDVHKRMRELEQAYMKSIIDSENRPQITLPDVKSMAPIKLIALDLDGTSLLAGKHFSPRLIKVIHLLQEKGIYVAICSGRAPESVNGFAKELKLDSAHGYCICFNGGSIININDITKDLYVSTINAQDLIDIEHEARKNECAIHAYTTRRLLLTESDIIFTEMEIAASMQPFERVKFPEEVNPQEKAYKVIAVGDEDKLDRMRASIPAEFKERFTIARTHINFLEFMQKGCHKGSALEKLCEILGITLENVVAFGDAENDIEMIAKAGVGVAMGNAMQALKDVAKYSTLNYFDDGVAIYLEKLFDLPEQA